MKHPPPQEWREFFRRLPKWIIVLVLAMLFGRFVLLAIFHLLRRGFHGPAPASAGSRTGGLVSPEPGAGRLA